MLAFLEMKYLLLITLFSLNVFATKGGDADQIQRDRNNKMEIIVCFIDQSCQKTANLPEHILEETFLKTTGDLELFVNELNEKISTIDNKQISQVHLNEVYSKLQAELDLNQKKCEKILKHEISYGSLSLLAFHGSMYSLNRFVFRRKFFDISQKLLVITFSPIAYLFGNSIGNIISQSGEADFNCIN